jgi:integrative and conjugative element protein (TIGR02256 family)
LRPARPVAWLAGAARLTIEREASSRLPLETGGLLLGYWVHDEAVIVEATTPGPRAGFAADQYIPDGRWDEQQVAAAYEQSGRIITYLGDWHSHPDGRLRLSSLDRGTLSRISGDRRARMSRPMMGIWTSRQRGTCVWVAEETADSAPRPRLARLVEWSGQIPDAV